jgi:hypothetical protein
MTLPSINSSFVVHGEPAHSKQALKAGPSKQALSRPISKFEVEV